MTRDTGTAHHDDLQRRGLTRIGLEPQPGEQDTIPSTIVPIRGDFPRILGTPHWFLFVFRSPQKRGRENGGERELAPRLSTAHCGEDVEVDLAAGMLVADEERVVLRFQSSNDYTHEP